MERNDGLITARDGEAAAMRAHDIVVIRHIAELRQTWKTISGLMRNAKRLAELLDVEGIDVKHPDWNDIASP